MKHFKLFGLHFYVSKYKLSKSPYERYGKVVEQIPHGGIKYSDLSKLLMTEMQMSYPASKHGIARLLKNGVIRKLDNGKYERV